MIRFVTNSIRNRIWRSGTLALGILAAAVSFVLLTGSSRTSSIQIKSTLTKSFRGAYDILVRPSGSYTRLEQRRGLVRDNYLSGIYGGISLAQYHEIASLPGVGVAAPIANIGTIVIRGSVRIPMKAFLTGAKDQLFRVRLSWSSQRNLSIYPATDLYIYATRRRLDVGAGGLTTRDPVTGSVVQVCEGFEALQAVPAPFVARNSTSLRCVSQNLSAQLRQQADQPGRPPSPRVSDAFFGFQLPVNFAAIDPGAEAKLVHLDRAVVGGRYLGEDSRPTVMSLGPGVGLSAVGIPVLESSRSFVDERLQATVERLTVPPGTDVPGTLAAGACPPPNVSCAPTDAAKGPPGQRQVTAYAFVSGLAGTVVGSREFSSTATYAATLRLRIPGRRLVQFVDNYWSGSPVQYRQLGATRLTPVPVQNLESSWVSGDTESGYLDQPRDNLDVQFRRLTDSYARNGAEGGTLLRLPYLNVVGRFDPNALPGFSPLSRVPLETYYPPTLEAADKRSRRLLHGKELLPSQNIGDYVQQPPMVLTTLASVHSLFSPAHFSGVPRERRRAPISVIRVRVAGVRGTDRLSWERIKTVAQLIHDRTGLAVDVTAGSSPTPIEIRLPAGRFGRPPLSLRERWTEKGVSVAYLSGLDRKDLGLFALVLVVCGFFLANGTFATVRARRVEIGTLRTLGWPGSAIFATVLGELVLVALVAGVAGIGLAAGLVQLLGLDFPPSRVFYVLPLALLLALAAGVVPALEASRGQPLDAIQPPVAPGRRGRADGIVDLALLNLRRLPLRTLIGASGLALGVAVLAILLAIERAFHGVLVGTLLGDAISVQVHAADLVALFTTLALAAFAVADVMYLNLRERASEFATLHTTGWSERQLITLVLIEAIALAAAGSLLGVVVGITVGTVLLGVPVAPLLEGALLAIGAGVGASVIASFASALRFLSVEPVRILAGE